MTRGGRNAEPGYEQSDIHVGVVVIFTAVLVVACAILMAAMVWLYSEFRIHEQETAHARQPATRVPLPGPNRPPEPVLQGAPGSRFELQDPSVEMVEQRARMDEVLSTSGWVDRNAGVTRIPIEHAKKLLLERGLPVREEPTGAEIRP